VGQFRMKSPLRHVVDPGGYKFRPRGYVETLECGHQFIADENNPRARYCKLCPPIPDLAASTVTSSHIVQRMQAVLRAHWLTEINRDAGAQARCACGARCQTRPTTNRAVRSWVEHVTAVLAYGEDPQTQHSLESSC
jgi:hypothetical protein